MLKLLDNPYVQRYVPGVSKILSGIKIGVAPQLWFTLPSVYTSSNDIPTVQGDVAVAASANAVDNVIMQFINDKVVQVYLHKYVSKVGRVNVDRYCDSSPLTFSIPSS